MVNGLLDTHDPNFGSLSWFWRCKEHRCPLSLNLGLWWELEVPDWGLASWSWLEYGYWSLLHPYSEFQLSILNLKVQRISMSFKSLLVSLVGAGGSWLGFGILTLIWIWWGSLFGFSLKFSSHSDQPKLRYSQFGMSTTQNKCQFGSQKLRHGRVGSGSGLGLVLNLMTAQLRLSRSI